MQILYSVSKMRMWRQRKVMTKKILNNRENHLWLLPLPLPPLLSHLPLLPLHYTPRPPPPLLLLLFLSKPSRSRWYQSAFSVIILLGKRGTKRKKAKKFSNKDFLENYPLPMLLVLLPRLLRLPLPPFQPFLLMCIFLPHHLSLFPHSLLRPLSSPRKTLFPTPMYPVNHWLNVLLKPFLLLFLPPCPFPPTFLPPLHSSLLLLRPQSRDIFQRRPRMLRMP
mmetsp:Transcript_7615/g.14937  ORF Transcript_7615/g.14937 Transcript_7615/m.14937 type:complete len:222 (+) Transcript_7615:87-752(+)